MNARARRRSILGAMALTVLACKPEAPAETTAAGSPEEGPAPTAEAAPSEPEAAASDGAASDGASAPDTPTDGDEEIAAAQKPDVGPTIPEEPYKVLMLGDSLVATGIGALLEKKLDAHPHAVCYRKGKSSSGLARADFYDWIDQAKRQVEFRDPDLVIVILGGNDGQDITRRGKSKRFGWNSETWPQGYRERMDAFLAEVTGPERRVMWIGLPVMGLRSLEKKLVLIRGVQKEAIDALGDTGVYIDTLPFVTNEDGGMLTKAKVGPKGKLQTLRSDDKIHFTMAGSEYMADILYPKVLEVLALPDVQPEP